MPVNSVAYTNSVNIDFRQFTSSLRFWQTTSIDMPELKYY